MLSVAETRARILAPLRPVGAETVGLDRAVGRVLARPVMATRTQPPFAASAMDGYAARAGDVRPHAVLRVIGETAAGARFDGHVGPGEAVRIFTGAPVPDGADRIVIQEDTTREGDSIRLREGLDKADYIRPAGLDFALGDRLLEADRRLTPRDIALVAAAGSPFVTVRRRPRVAILATGDELVLPGEAAGAAQIVSSNNFGLAAVVAEAGGLPQIVPIAADTPESLLAAAHAARGADLFITLGGASVGDHDLIRPVLGEHGLKLDLYKIAMRPGKPLMAGRLGDVPMLGLPGNPVSAMLCAHLFVRAVLDALLGLPAAAPADEPAVLAGPLPANGPREHYMRARLTPRAQAAPLVEVFEDQDSSRLALLSRADVLVIRAPRAAAAAAGENVRIMRL